MRCLHGMVLCAVILLGGTAELAAEGPPSLDATKVVVRSKSEFSAALEAALHPLLVDSPTRAVLFVLDVTPNVRKNIDKLRAGLRSAQERHPDVASWSFARLGERAAQRTNIAGGLGQAVSEGVAKDTPVVSTLAALTNTLKRSKVRDTAIVYINDWRFEDDVDLEGFIKNLKRRGNSLSIVGSEAGFGRAWNDGWVSADDRIDLNDPSGFKLRDYHEGIGRSPFAKGDDDAPWHGGDTAYPYAPYRWPVTLWHFEFTEYDFTSAASKGSDDPMGLLGEDGEPPDFEELERRLKDGGEFPPMPGGPPLPEDPRVSADRDANRYFPIPAAYGPYGLMRTAAVTGGRYVLWSWNPGGRRKVHYEYSRCNLFPPDLRSRKQILKSLRKNLLAAAMLKAWAALEAAHGNVVKHSAPLKSNLRTARSIDRFPSGSGEHMPISWRDKSDWRTFQRSAESALEALDHAAQFLDQALEKTPEAPPEATIRRYRAAAELFRHGVRVVHLEIANGLAASRSLPKNAWSNGDKIPGVAGRAWIRHGHDPESMRLTEDVPTDTARGEAVRLERKRMLTRYRGTPFAEIVGLNDVEPLQFTWWEIGGSLPDMGRSPSESDGGAKPNRPGGPSSGGGGPTTGK